jgi:hypothetical protein
MVYLLKMVIFHGYVSHNQMVSNPKKNGLELDGRQVYVFAAMTEYHVYGAMEVWFVTAEIHHQALE